MYHIIESGFLVNVQSINIDFFNYILLVHKCGANIG